MKVLKIGAASCAGCKVMKPRWQEIEEENPWLETEFFDADQNKEILEKYQVKSLPSFIFLDKQGNEIERMSGEIEKDVLIEAVLRNKDK